ncbi:hypothetical protein E2C01_085260 [Portunus trituberculatus]|uniref:Uncharacterized protein n=1 Tax=Portunus trituberculatus TaxID=210409 RepID=A0A5B7J746_PORTR|nr:hypothetical protein [Portunus trituberculatus]
MALHACPPPSAGDTTVIGSRFTEGITATASEESSARIGKKARPLRPATPPPHRPTPDARRNASRSARARC